MLTYEQDTTFERYTLANLLRAKLCSQQHSTSQQKLKTIQISINRKDNDI